MFRSSPHWQDFGDRARNLMVLKELFHNKIRFLNPMQSACEVTMPSCCVFPAWRFVGCSAWGFCVQTMGLGVWTMQNLVFLLF